MAHTRHLGISRPISFHVSTRLNNHHNLPPYHHSGDGGSSQYVWIANSYLFSSTVPQPLYAQTADIFGRRNPLLVATLLFLLGSGLAGGARSVTTMIAGRVIQGLGSAGLYVLPEIILCDILPPRYRGPYLSAILSTAAIAGTIGPIIGGALAQADWRWIFWINLPVVVVGIVCVMFLFRMKYEKDQAWRVALSRVDFLGNSIFIPSMISLFFGLIMGGNGAAGYPWNSWQIILPLVLGILGWTGFHIHQSSSICHEPSIPTRLFKHRTSTIGFFMIFLVAIVSQTIGLFLPIYLQAVIGVSPMMSGVYYLPFALGLLILAGAAGAILSKTGLYKPVHWVGWILSAIGAGLFSTLNANSSTGAWVGFQVIAAGGVGFIFTVTLPSTLASLPESDVAVATGTYAFLRTFGFVWGVTISSIIFNGQVNAHLETIADPSVRLLLADGAAYTYASGIDGGRMSINALQEPSKSQVIKVYVQAIRVIWLFIAGISCLGFIATFIERQIELRRDNKTKFGLTKGEGVSCRHVTGASL